MVEVCYDRMTEILSCREFSKGWECRSVENANFISRKTLQALPKAVVDVSRSSIGDLQEKSASAERIGVSDFLHAGGSNRRDPTVKRCGEKD